MIVRKTSKIILEILREEIFSNKIILEFRTRSLGYARISLVNDSADLQSVPTTMRHKAKEHDKKAASNLFL
jgi:hypothetical protein